MHNDTTVFLIFVIFFGAAILGTVAMYTRQSLLVAYMLLGAVLGPFGLMIIPKIQMVADVGEIGIIFLLFLLGLHLQPKNLILLLRKTVLLTIASSVIFAVVGYIIGVIFHFTQLESLVLGGAMMFSSTIIGLKLLPTTILHHKHTGEVMISILLLQDVLAIIVLLLLKGGQHGHFDFNELGIIVISLPFLFVVSTIFVRFILLKLLARFDTMQEYVWLVSIGWCLLLTQVAYWMHLSVEIGAFIAGVSLAEHPISQYIAESLKPLRDLFLVAFFFSVGAYFDTSFLPVVIVPAILLALGALLLKPLIYRFLLVREGESKSVAWEVGVRLGQASEFSLLVAYLAGNHSMISDKMSFLIQASTIITFVVSTYWVVWKYPTPMATSAKLRQD